MALLGMGCLFGAVSSVDIDSSMKENQTQASLTNLASRGQFAAQAVQAQVKLYLGIKVKVVR